MSRNAVIKEMIRQLHDLKNYKNMVLVILKT